MPVTSPASAAEARPIGEVLPLKIARIKATAPRAQGPEALARLAWRGFEPLLHGLRRTWIYRATLRGVLPDRFVFHPEDPRPRQLELADGIMRGRFKLAGQTVEIENGSVFDSALPSPEFAAALHGFDWLRHLEAAGGNLAHDAALTLTKDWLKRYGYYALPAWRPEITAERLFNLCAHGKFFLANTDWIWRAKLFVSLRNQMVVLWRSLDEAKDGLPRLKAAAALVISGVCLGDEKSISRGLKFLALEIERQVLPDGGHISRSPEALLDACQILVTAQQAIDWAARPMDMPLRTALDRMLPMLRFFTLGDGALPAFNGGNEGKAQVIAALLADEEHEIRPLGYAPNSGFQRLASGSTMIVLDAGCAPPPESSAAAHAGCLAFEMSSGGSRIVVNCGTPVGREPEWTTALRATAAHTTVTLDDASQAIVAGSGWLTRMLGPRLSGGPTNVETRRMHDAKGMSVEATQDGYVSRYGLLHQRRLTLSAKGMKIFGVDRLIPVKSKVWDRLRERRGANGGIPFAVRFHIHPDVRVSLAQARGTVILKLASGEGWRFRCSGGTISVEESLYFGGGSFRRAEQLVIGATVREATSEVAWVFEQVTAA